MPSDPEFGKIYKYTCRASGKAYIGQTRRGLQDRAGPGGANYLRCRKFANAIKKYGWDGFDVEILLDDCHKSLLNHYERLFISAFDTYRNGYNCTEGGEDNPSNHPEVNKKRREARKRKRIARGIIDGMTKICCLKDCKHAGAVQSVKNFYADKDRNDGFNYVCKDCQATYREKNRDKIREKQADYYQKNRDKIREKQAAYREKNRDKLREKEAAYREKNRDKILEYKAAYYKKNKTDPLYKITLKINTRRQAIRKRKANRGLTDFTAVYAADEKLQTLLRERVQLKNPLRL